MTDEIQPKFKVVPPPEPESVFDDIEGLRKTATLKSLAPRRSGQRGGAQAGQQCIFSRPL